MYFDVRAAKLLAPGRALAVQGCPGLRLVANKTTRTWTYRHRNAAGQLKQIKLGFWPEMSVQDAVAKWNAARAERADGVDLVVQRKEEKAEARRAALPDAGAYTVAKLVQDYITGHLYPERQRDGAVAAERALLRALDDHQALARKAAAEVSRQDAFDVLEARRATPAAASKLRALLGAAWDYALDSGRLDGAAPNWWRVVMRGRLKSRGKVMGGQHVGPRRRFLIDDEVRTLLRWLPNMHETGADITVLYLWTGARGAEIVAMQPQHLSERAGVLWWTVPKALTKNARYEHAVDLRVPLFGRARDVVQHRLKRTAPDRWLFAGDDGGHYTQHQFSTYIYDLQPYSPKSRRAGRVREVLPVTDWTPHNLRRTVRTMLAALGCPREIGEAILGHMPPEIEATYNAWSYDAQRVEWLRKLNDRLESLLAQSDGQDTTFV